METTPLELYETAYRLHYHENRITDAVAYYQKLIEEFPDSNECGYAVIQLQKIKVHEVTDSLKSIIPSRKQTFCLSPLAIISLVLSVLAFVALGHSYRSLNKKIVLEEKRLSLALGALGNISRGEDNEALKLLSELKLFYAGNIIPWELSAYIYRKQLRFEEARKEYETFFRLNPNQKFVEKELILMQLKEKPNAEKQVLQPELQQTLQQSAPRPTPPAPSATMKKRPLRSRTDLTKPPSPGPRNKKDGLFLVDPDSISYF